MKLILYLFLTILVFGCANNKPDTRYKPTVESIERGTLTNKIRGQVAATLQRNHRLRPLGFGGQTSNGVQMLSLSFEYLEPIDFDKGRELLMCSVNEFVSAVNSEEK